MGSRQTHLLSKPPFVVDQYSLVRSSGRQVDWSRVPESFRSGPAYQVVVGAAGALANATTVPVDALPVALPAGTFLDFGGKKFVRLAAPAAKGATSLTTDAIPTAVVDNDVAYYKRDGKKSLPAGTVVSELSTGKVVPRGANDTSEVRTAVGAAVAGNTGNGTIGSVTADATAKIGVYTITIIEPASDAGAFMVEDPDGVNLGNGDVAVAFSAGGIGFTIADGATNFVAGDQFTVTVDDTQAGSDINGAFGLLETLAIEDDPTAVTGYGVLIGGVIYENMLPEATGTPKKLPTAIKQELNAAGTGFAWEQYGDSRAD